MASRTFRPEVTAPLIDKEVLRLKFLSFIYMRYPAKCKDLLTAWPLFDVLLPEMIYLLKSAAVFSSNDESLDTLQTYGTAIGCGELLGKLILWAKSINLPYAWVVTAGLWVFRSMKTDESVRLENLSLRLAVAFARVQGEISALPALHVPVTNQAGVFGVLLPRFMPTRQSELAYRAECKNILDEYISRENCAHLEKGLSRPHTAPSEDEHIEWLAMTLIEGLSARQVAQRVSDERTYSFQAVAKALKSMAGRIGVNLERRKQS